ITVQDPITTVRLL
nr:immunoglobulin heavy chain junction region [Mus musculus]